ncbi:MAG: hypothetical protein ABFS56_29260 [Pseudomonadota bacterium]
MPINDCVTVKQLTEEQLLLVKRILIGLRYKRKMSISEIFDRLSKIFMEILFMSTNNYVTHGANNVIDTKKRKQMTIEQLTEEQLLLVKQEERKNVTSVIRE